MLFLTPSAAGTAPRTKVKQTTGPINALAMDGARIAYYIGNPRIQKGPGNKILVWNTLTGKVTKVSGKLTDQADITSTGSGVRELAIAGKRVAWIINVGGLTESDDDLFESSVALPKEQIIAESMRRGPDPDSPGDWISGLVGAGNLLWVNRWSADGSGAITRAGLHLLGTMSLKRIAAGAPTILARSADVNRVAVLRSDGTVAVYSTAGKVLLQVAPSQAQAIALNGRFLAVITKARKLEVYESIRGSLLKTISIRGDRRYAPANLDLEGKFAVYTLYRDLHALNLVTGKDRVLGTMKGRGIGFAQIEPAGVAYAGNVRNKPVRGSETGTIVFVPFARVVSAVS
jgi:hypothetical protein